MEIEDMFCCFTEDPLSFFCSVSCAVLFLFMMKIYVKIFWKIVEVLDSRKEDNGNGK